MVCAYALLRYRPHVHMIFMSPTHPCVPPHECARVADFLPKDPFALYSQSDRAVRDLVSSILVLMSSTWSYTTPGRDKFHRGLWKNAWQNQVWVIYGSPWR